MSAQGALNPVSLANELRPALLRLARQLRRESHALGVTAGQLTLLAAIQKQPGIGVRELAAGEGVSAPNISVHVRRLERAGLVARTTGKDRRRIGLRVTPEAVRVIHSVKSRRTAWLASRLRQLESDQLEAIRAAVEPLTRLADESE
jgi:DNA-binding MarR family transcriptional regulator